MIADLKQALRQQLADNQTLRKRQSWRRGFSPSLSYGRHFGPAKAGAKKAAVMILLEPREGRWTIPLTVRPQHLPDHPGQICFPGGRLEGNESFQQAAEREFQEELGVDSVPGEIIGELLPIFVYNSNYFVRPFLAIADEATAYAPCEHEVERLIHLPVSSLADQRGHRVFPFSRGSITWRAHAIENNADLVWGATAIMLGELAAIVADCPMAAVPADDGDNGPTL